MNTLNGLALMIKGLSCNNNTDYFILLRNKFFSIITWVVLTGIADLCPEINVENGLVNCSKVGRGISMVLLFFLLFLFLFFFFFFFLFIIF